MSCLDERIIDDIEVILVNDGSKDNSLYIANKMKTCYPHNVLVVDKPNGGKGSCMNVGISKATGKYLRELDSDDYFAEGSVYELVSKLKEYDVDVVHTNFRRVYVDSSKIVNIIVEGLKYSQIIDLRTEVLPDHTYRMHALTYKTEFLRRINFIQSEGVSYTDNEYVYYPLINAESFIAFDIILYCYQLGIAGQSVSFESMKKNLAHRRKLLDRFLKDTQFLEGNEIAKNVRAFTLSGILRPILIMYLIYSDYDMETEVKLRMALNEIKNQDRGVYYKMINKFGKFGYVVKEWLFLGKCHFGIRWIFKSVKI